MKVVCFEVAKKLNKIGFIKRWDEFPYYYNSLGVLKYCDEDPDEIDEIEEISIEDIEFNHRFCIPAPTYFEIYVWLWVEKHIRFGIEDLWSAKDISYERGCVCGTKQLGGICTPEVENPEEAIIKAVNYVILNDLVY